MTSLTIPLCGAVTLGITASSPWHEALQRRFAPWLGMPAVVDWQISIAVDDTLSAPVTPLFEVTPRFDDAICLLSDEARRGTIDTARRIARLRAHPLASEADVRYFLRMVAALALFQAGALLVHAAGVVSRGQALLFVGRSGSGKSTVVALGGGRPVLHDDLVCLLQAVEGWRVAPLPGETAAETSSVPLGGLLLLEKDAENRLQSLPTSTMLAELVANSPVVNAKSANLPALLAFWRRVLRFAPAGRLYFRSDETVWEVIDDWFG